MSPSNKQIIATWLYLEGPGEDGVYPQVPGKSSTSTFHDIYKRCLITFFTSARAANEDSELLLFSNINLNQTTREFDRRIVEMLMKLRVSIVILPYTYSPPSEQKMWRNQFFVMDVLKYFATSLKDSDLCLILDSDIIWSGLPKTQELWSDLAHFGSLTMIPISDHNEEINGLTITDLGIKSKLLGGLHPPSQYAGGEFIALRGDKLKMVYHCGELFWEKYISLACTEETTFMEEAHFLSIVYASLNVPFGNGDKYIKRIWTQVFHYTNRHDSDLDLVLWHLPAEKRFGIKRLADEYMSGRSEQWPSTKSREWINLTLKLGLENKLGLKVVRDIVKSIKDRLVKSN